MEQDSNMSPCDLVGLKDNVEGLVVVALVQDLPHRGPDLTGPLRAAQTDLLLYPWRDESVVNDSCKW